MPVRNISGWRGEKVMLLGWAGRVLVDRDLGLGMECIWFLM